MDTSPYRSDCTDHFGGHGWFGNSITAADSSDMWIQEGWTTHLESLYVEYMCGHDDAIKYLNGYQPKIKNDEPIITQCGVNGEPTQDQYFRVGLFINTLRSIKKDEFEVDADLYYVNVAKE